MGADPTGAEVRSLAELIGTVKRHRLALFAGAMVVLVAWLLWTARSALPAFIIAIALAFVLDPGVTRIARLGVPRWVGVLAMYVLSMGVIWIVISFAVPPIAGQTERFIGALPMLGAALGDAQRTVEEWYRGLALPADVRAMIDESIQSGERALLDFLRALLAPTLNAILRAATFILGLVVVPVWLFFVLKDRDRLGPTVALALPPGWRADASNVLGILSRIGGRWVRGQLLLGAAVFAATVIGLSILTIWFPEFGEFTLVLALIAGVLEWFPIIGPILAAVPAILIGATVSLPATIAALVLYVVVQQLENNFLVPKVMGDAVELNPAVLILGLVVGGSLFGIGGAILAAPTVAIGRDLYRYGFLRLSGEAPEVANSIATGRHRPSPAADVAEARAEAGGERAAGEGDRPAGQLPAGAKPAATDEPGTERPTGVRHPEREAPAE